MTGELKSRYSYVYIMGDYDRHSLPDVNDIDAFDSLKAAERERYMVARENDIPESHYVIVRSYATPWEVIDE